jgi:hypothetical protein
VREHPPTFERAVEKHLTMIASTAQAAGQKVACKQSCSTPLAPARCSGVRAAARAHTGLDSKVRQVIGGLATRLG